MKKRKIFYVEYLSPGALCANSWTREIAAPQPSAVDWPKNAYAFKLFERTDVIDGDSVFKGAAKQVGPLYYHPDSKIETLDQVKDNPNSTKILIRNMECNKWESIIWTRWGNWPQPFERGKCEILGAP